MFKKFDNKDIIEQKLSQGNVKRYVKGRLLGKGGFAKCYQVISLQTQKKYAAKIIQKASLQKSKAKQKLTSQIKIHKSLEHPNVVHFQHYFQDSQFVYILLQKCPNQVAISIAQTLNQLLKRRKRLTDIQTKYYVRQIALAIKYLHQQLIIHRDLKLGNLFLSEKLEIKIGDFGLATKITYPGQRKKTKCGTPNYIAPEILQDKKTHSYEVDIWSMGVITFALLVGRPPFQTNDVKQTYNKIKQCSYEFPQSANVSLNAKKFIQRMLQLDPSKRATIDELLSDSFLTQSSIPPLLPLSSLACPPSLQFLKKYRQAEFLNQKSINKCQSLGNISLKFDKKTIKDGNDDERVQKLQPKFSSRINSTHKTDKKFQRMEGISSATNLHKKNITHNKQMHKMKNFAKNSLQTWISLFQQNAKFGTGYLLNNQEMGFRYNDSSAMISNSSFNKFRYIQISNQNKQLDEQNSKVYTLQQIQQTEYKKFKILKHFSILLHQRVKQINKLRPNYLNNTNNKMKQNGKQLGFYIIRHHRTSKCNIFWFNVGAMQAIFDDGSQIHMNSNNIITYIDKCQQFVYFQKNELMSQNQQIRKRVMLINSVVKTVLKKRQQKECVSNGIKKQKQNTGIIRCDSIKNTKSQIREVHALNISDANNTLKGCKSQKKLNINNGNLKVD